MNGLDLELERVLQDGAWLRHFVGTLVAPQDVDDVVQSAWLAAVEEPGRARGPLGAWLRGVSANVARLLHRSRHRRARAFSRLPEPGNAPAAADVAAGLEAQRAVSDALLALPEPTRTILVLRYQQGLSPQVIAPRVGLRVDAVRQRLHRGREAVRERLQQRFGADWRGCAPIVAFALQGEIATPTVVAVSLAIAALAVPAALATFLFVNWSPSLPIPPATTSAAATTPLASKAPSAGGALPAESAAVTQPDSTAPQRSPVTSPTAARTLRLRVEHGDGREAAITDLSWRSPSGERVAAAREGTGTFRLAPPDGWQQLVLHMKGPEVRHAQRLVLPRDVTPDGDVVLRLPDATDLRLRLLHHVTNAPVLNVAATLRWDATAHNDRIPRGPRTESSAADGVMTFAALDVGAYAITVADGHRIVRPNVIEVTARSEIIDVFVASDEDWRIRGRVVADFDPSRGIGDVVLSVIGGAEVARSGADGRFELPGALRQTVREPYLRLVATPPAGLGLAATEARPFAWQQQDIVVELPTTKHRLEVRTNVGGPIANAISHRSAQGGRVGGGTWQALAASVTGDFELPWDEQWRFSTWLRLDDAATEGQPRHVRFDQLPKRAVGDTIVHRWSVPAPRPVVIVVQEGPALPLAGAEVEVVFHAGSSSLPNAKAVAATDYDPATVNMMFDNRVQRLAHGNTGGDGTLTVTCAWQPGVALRCKCAGHAEEIVEVGGAEQRIVVTMAACGSLRGAIREAPGNALVTLIPAEARPAGMVGYESRRLTGEDFHFPNLRVGVYTIGLASNRFDELLGRTRQQQIELGRVEIQRGVEAEFRTTARGALGELAVELSGDDLAIGDRLEARVVGLWGGDSVTVAHTGRASLKLAAGSYRLVRQRSHADTGTESFVFAESPLVVRRGEQRFTPRFVSAPGRVRLLVDGRPAKQTWVAIDGVGGIVPTDGDGWATFALWPGDAFALLEVRWTNSGWRPTGPRWALTRESVGTDVAAER